MNVDHSTRLLFIGLITQADDHGRGTADPRRLKAAIYGGDDITSSSVRRWLDELVAQNLVVIYETASHGLLYELPSWKTHQKIDRAKQSAYPSSSEALRIVKSLEALVDDSSIDRRSVVGDRIGSEGSLGSDRTVPEGGGIVDASANGNGETVSDCEDSYAFEQAIMVRYPKGSNQSNWTKALKDASQLVGQRLATWAELVEATERYARYFAASTSSTNVAAHNFFDSNKGNQWQQSWAIIAKTNGKPASNLPKSTREYEDDAIVRGIAEGKSDIDIAAEVEVPIDRVRILREVKQHADH
jgi:hypothetical protein